MRRKQYPCLRSIGSLLFDLRRGYINTRTRNKGLRTKEEKTLESDKKSANQRRVSRADVISVIALIVSVLTLVFSEFPQMKPFNTNYEGKANAGDDEAQMYLANYNHLIGNDDRSIYWYLILAQKEGKYQGEALYNLAQIYIREEKTYLDRFPNYYDDILTILWESLDKGYDAAGSAIYSFLDNHKALLTKEDIEGYDEIYGFMGRELCLKEWYVSSYEEKTVNSTRWSNQTKAVQTGTHEEKQQLYVYQILNEKSNGIGDVDIDYSVTTYSRSEMPKDKAVPSIFHNSLIVIRSDADNKDS